MTRRRPLLLDLYCGAGGAAVGYQRAGFDVVGVDVAPQRNYPFEFIEYDALQYLSDIVDGCDWRPYDAIHASPPCQRHSRMSNCRPGLASTYPALIEPTRVLLDTVGLPYVIENVEDSPLINPITLCGSMFGRELYRHRLFESNIGLRAPRVHPAHTVPASKAGHWTPGTVMSVSGHIAPIAHARSIMGIDWTNRHELAESIPPDYSEFVGRQLIKHVRAQ